MGRPRGSYGKSGIAWEVRITLEANANRSWSVAEIESLLVDIYGPHDLPATADLRNAINSAVANWLKRGLIVRVARGRYRAHPDNPDADWFD